jgi:hypothetical protein
MIISETIVLSSLSLSYLLVRPREKETILCRLCPETQSFSLSHLLIVECNKF